MIIYNVTVKVEPTLAAEWVQWMKETHIPELMATGLFEGHRLCHLLETDESEGVTYVAQYYLPTEKDYRQYIDQYATEMRERGLKRFGNGFVAFRTLMESL
jgi:hypothetical protein